MKPTYEELLKLWDIVRTNPDLIQNRPCDVDLFEAEEFWETVGEATEELFEKYPDERIVEDWDDEDEED